LKKHGHFYYDEILERDIVQLNAILDRLPKHIEISMGIPGMFGGGGGAVEPEPRPTGKPPKLSEIVNFCSGFSGGK